MTLDLVAPTQPIASATTGFHSLIQSLEAWRAHDPVLDRDLSDRVLLADGWTKTINPSVAGGIVWAKEADRRQFRTCNSRPHPVCDFVAARAMLPAGWRYSLNWTGSDAIAVVWPLPEGLGNSEIGSSPSEPVALLNAIFRVRQAELERSMLAADAGGAA